MIRVVTIGSVLCLLVLVLYLPSAHPPEHFLAQLRSEHRTMSTFWGDAPALGTLSRALALQQTAREATPVPSPADAPQIGAVGAAVASEMASVSRRLFDNAYFRSIDALALLAAYRLSTLLEWLPWLAAFAAAALTDGAVTRQIRAREFRHHDPEHFALYSCLAIMAACAAVVAFVVPVTLHPLVMPGAALAISLLASRAVANFHLRAT